MKIIDKYIIKKFIFTFLFIVASLLAIAMIINLAERIGRFIEFEVPLTKVIWYYSQFCLFYGITFMPLAIFISVIYFTSKLSSNTEIIAMFSAGISYNRLLWPFFVSATILTLWALWANHFLLPASNEQRNEFEYLYLKSDSKKSSRYNTSKISRKVSDNEYVFIESFDIDNEIGYGFTYERFENGIMKTKIVSNSIDFNKSDSTYTLRYFRMREIRDGWDKLVNGSNKDTIFPFLPGNLITKIDEAQALNYSELKNFIQEERKRGSERLYIYKLEHYRRTAMPFSTYILSLIAITLSTRKKRGGIGLNIALGIFLAFIYIFLMQIADAFVTDGIVNSFTAVWIPNFLFFTLAIYLYLKAKK